MGRLAPDTAASYASPATSPSPGLSLPAVYTPLAAGYARGPYITPETVTPTDWRWRSARTYIVTDADGTNYRCVRVFSGGRFIGYWAVELLGEILSAFEE